MKVNEANSYIEEQKQMIRINQSQAFCLLAFVISFVPVVYLTIFSDVYEVSAITDITKIPATAWLAIVPAFYLIAFNSYSIHADFAFRVVSKLPLVLSIGLYKLFTMLFTYSDIVLHTAWLNIRRVWTFEERLEFVSSLLSSLPNGKLVEHDTIAVLAKNNQSIQDLKTAVNSAIHDAMNPSWFDLWTGFRHEHGPKLCLVGLSLICFGVALKYASSYLSSQNEQLSQINQALEELQSEIDALRDAVEELNQNVSSVVGEVNYHVVQVGQAIDLLANDAAVSTIQSNSLVRFVNDHFADLLIRLC